MRFDVMLMAFPHLQNVATLHAALVVKGDEAASAWAIHFCCDEHGGPHGRPLFSTTTIREAVQDFMSRISSSLALH